jgi:bifunctional non-homologous end joining protein LigD
MSSKPEVTIAGVRLTSPDRVLYAEQGITKRDLASYYEEVREWILPHLADRPLTLIRCPRGQEQSCFVQRHAQEGVPEAVKRVEVEGEEPYLRVDGLPGLITLVQLGVLELHTWGARRDRLERPDRMILDLDPDPALPWERVVEAAQEVRDRLEKLGLESFVKTTGGKGLHVVVPLVRRSTWEEVREFARALAEDLSRRAPERYLAEASKEERAGKIYLDYLRNAWSASAIAAFSTRARPGAPVSVPLSWEELDSKLRPGDFTVKTVPRRLAELSTDPWEGFARTRQGLTKAVRKELGLK